MRTKSKLPFADRKPQPAPRSPLLPLELSPAKAALWLLNQLHDGELSFLVNGQTPQQLEPVADVSDHAFSISREDLADWIGSMCLDALAAGLKGADVAVGRRLVSPAVAS